MPGQTIDLDAYFRHIGYDGPRAPSHETLRALHYAHTMRVPFENIDVLMKMPIHLDGAALQEKIVHQGRGGYCFEQNGLFLRVLRQMGFEATGLIGRVRWRAAEGVETPQTHMLIRVDLPDGVFVADVGFGGYRMTEPIRLVGEVAQQTAHGQFRLVSRGVEFDLQAELNGKWADLCRFTLQPQLQIDYELSNWYTSTHPTTIFTNHLFVELPGRDGHYLLLDNELTIRRPGAEPEFRRLTAIEEMVRVLRQDFRLEVRSDAERDMLADFVARPPGRQVP